MTGYAIGDRRTLVTSELYNDNTDSSTLNKNIIIYKFIYYNL